MSKKENTLPISDANAEPPVIDIKPNQEKSQEHIAPPKNEQSPEKKPQQSVVVKISEAGLFKFTDHIELRNAASMAVQLSMVPEKLTKEGGVVAASAALMFCQQFNLPMKAMNEMGWIEGCLTIYGSLYWALAERHPEFGEHEMFWIDENCEKICVQNKNLKTPVWGAVIRCRKKNSTVWNEYSFTKDEAETAKLWPPKKWSKEDRKQIENPNSPWAKYFKDMIMHKVKKRCIDANYSSALNGCIYHEDAFEHLSEPRNVTPEPKETNNDDILKAFNASKETQTNGND